MSTAKPLDASQGDVDAIRDALVEVAKWMRFCGRQIENELSSDRKRSGVRCRNFCRRYDQLAKSYRALSIDWHKCTYKPTKKYKGN